MSQLWTPGDIAEILWGLAMTNVHTAVHVGRQDQKTREFCLGFLTAILIVSHSLHAAKVISDTDSQLRLSDRILGLLERTRSEHETV